MPIPPKHDYENDRIETGFNRLRSLARALETIESLMVGILLVVFGVLLGAVAGAAITREWIGITAGAVLGAAAGLWMARRRLVREHVFAEKPPEVEPALDAPHMPGVQEQFARARARTVVLCFPLCASLGILLIMLKEGTGESMFPAWMHESRSVAVLAGVAAASFVLIVMYSRCPQCRHRLHDVARVRRCPHCGIALRD